MTKAFALAIYCKSQKAKVEVTDIRNILMHVLKLHRRNSITC